MLTMIGLVSAYARILQFQPVILAYLKYYALFIGFTTDILIELDL